VIEYVGEALIHTADEIWRFFSDKHVVAPCPDGSWDCKYPPTPSAGRGVLSRAVVLGIGAGGALMVGLIGVVAKRWSVVGVRGKYASLSQTSKGGGGAEVDQ
jgi:hypothetical protein